MKHLQDNSTSTTNQSLKDKNFHTIESNSLFAITLEEINALDKKRPFGLSGHMRVKNEEATIEASVHSIMPVLDELILSVQPSEDKTYELALKLKDTYKDKLKLIYYTPSVLPAHSSHVRVGEEMKSVLKRFEGVLPAKSIHSLAHFYNHGMIKVSYSHYMKVDADQIYLTRKCQELKEALKLIYDLDSAGFKISKLGKLKAKLIAKYFLRPNLKLTVLSYYLAYKNTAFALGGINIGLSKAQFKDIYKDYDDKKNEKRYALGSFSGPFKNGALKDLDITKLKTSFFKSGEKCMLKECLVPLKNNDYPPYNGSELLVLEVTKDNLYKMDKDYKYEVMPVANVKSLQALGIFWLHFGLVKRNYFISGECFKDYIPIKNYIKASKSFLLSSITNATSHTLNHIKVWHKKDSKDLKKLLEKSLDSMQD
ncbi:hypothetical protein BKH43_01540 [Helicobacter sp. 13S00401-1]|uniref:hypothetical protein n=1 Tax=Helicobacter sp. 13S00401-1 TaxID=1905758 RepID=UPI000BA6B0DD|nr:hypothetical protein [Helicobacter sp. 13S00401-1]PAF51349.1 hypothetical protein BKH43_01540 [Helicobacter sp. 13S00401-1]